MAAARNAVGLATLYDTSPSCFSRFRLPALAVAALFALVPRAETASPDSAGFSLELPNHQRYTLTVPADSLRLAPDLDQLIRDEEEYLAQRKAERKKLRAETPLAEMSPAQLKSYHAEPMVLPTNNELRGLRTLQVLARQLDAATTPDERTNTLRLMVEIARSLENLHCPPIPARVEVGLIPFLFLDYLHRPVGRGTTVAANLQPPPGSTDASRTDPPDSTFWRKPAAIAQADLFHCLGRGGWPDYAQVLWEYDEPKTSFGANPGFTLKSGRVELKAKFGEVHSEPFTVRIFHALGYNVEQTDYAPSLRIKYDRRLFREFHQRKELDLEFRVLAVVPVLHLALQRRHDPFQFITEAVLKDGTRLTGQALKARLLLDPKRAQPEDDPANFDRAFEATIAHLVTREANVQVRDPGAQNLGPWRFGGLGHEHLRELRGVALLAAWLGWTDTRCDNTRIKVVTTGAATEVKHYFSDLGGGLGKGAGLFSWQSDAPNLFDWTFTTPPRRVDQGRLTIPFRIVNYRPIDRTPAFKEMTTDDARWMARLIAQLTEAQLIQGLIASGWDDAEVRLLTEKLLSRRDRMIQDLGLAAEIPPLRPEGARRNLAYDPVEGSTKGGRPMSQKIVAGRIVSRSESR